MACWVWLLSNMAHPSTRFSSSAQPRQSQEWVESLRPGCTRRSMSCRRNSTTWRQSRGAVQLAAQTSGEPLAPANLLFHPELAVSGHLHSHIWACLIYYLYRLDIFCRPAVLALPTALPAHFPGHANDPNVTL